MIVCKGPRSIKVRLTVAARYPLAIRMARRQDSQEVIEALAEVMVWRGIPEHLRSDNGPEFIAQELRKWLGNLGTGTILAPSCADPGKPPARTDLLRA
ncbi:MAG: integrase catalytic domain-containing protein [Terriglobia bacterium]